MTRTGLSRVGVKLPPLAFVVYVLIEIDLEKNYEYNDVGDWPLTS